MDKIKDTRSFMRITHRYLGFFLAYYGSVCSKWSFIDLQRYRFSEKEKKIDKVIAKNLSEKELGKELKMKNLEVEKTEGSVLKFKQGTYDAATGQAKYTKKNFLLC